MKIQSRIPLRNAQASSEASAFRLLRFTPSTFLFVAVLIVHAFAIAAIFLSALPSWVLWAIVVLLLAHFTAFGYRWFVQPIYRLQQYEHRWVLIEESAEARTLRIMSCYYCSPLLVILRAQSESNLRCFYLPIFVDCCCSDDFRRLRVLAKYFL